MAAATATGDKFCAASIDGNPCRIEYGTATEDGTPYVYVVAVHLAGKRIKANWFRDDAISDFERECEAAEMLSEQCAWGIPTPDSTAPWRIRRAA